MANKRPVRRHAVLHYPSHWFKPEDCLSFLALPVFTRQWEGIGLGDEDLGALQIALMVNPQGAPVIEGTGGVRKLRFAPRGWPGGKSGALRVCYAYIEEVGTIVLGVVYQKGEKDDLSENEKTAIRLAIDRIRQALLSRPYRCKLKTGT